MVCQLHYSLVPIANILSLYKHLRKGFQQMQIAANSLYMQVHLSHNRSKRFYIVLQQEIQSSL